MTDLGDPATTVTIPLDHRDINCLIDGYRRALEAALRFALAESDKSKYRAHHVQQVVQLTKRLAQLEDLYRERFPEEFE